MKDELHTVALYVPGTQARVLVDRLECSVVDAHRTAREVVSELAAAGPVLWATTVVHTEEITDVLTPPETT